MQNISASKYVIVSVVNYYITSILLQFYITGFVSATVCLLVILVFLDELFNVIFF